MTDMIPPELSDKSIEDITVGLHAPKHSTRDPAFISRMLAALHASVPDLSPDSYHLMTPKDDLEESPRTPLNDHTVPEIVQTLQSTEVAYIFLNKGDPPNVSILLSSRHVTAVPYDVVALSVQREVAESPPGRRRLVTAGHSIARTCDAYLGSFEAWRLLKTAARGRLILSDLQHGLPPPQWGFLLGRDYVELLGADRLKTAPCEVIEELPGGFMLLLLREDFTRLEDDRQDFERRREGLVRHLGPEFFHYVEGGPPKRVLPAFR